MAIIPAIFTLIGRWLSRILNTAFGWATMMLFGKVPKDRQIYLSIITFGSVAWLVLLLGVIFPRVGTFLLTFVTLPTWVDDTWIRLAMLSGALLLPLVVGFVSIFVLDPEDRPQGTAAKAKLVVKGYLFTFGLAVTLIMMTVFAPLLKVRPFLKRWSSQHVPVMVEPEDYLGVVGEMQRALKTAGWETIRHPSSVLMRLPTKVLTTVAGGTIQNLVADELTVLKSPDLEVELHPSDMIISGKELDVAHARGTIAEQLAFSNAYMTWDKESHGLEDRLRAIWRGMRVDQRDVDQHEAAKRLEGVERDLQKLEIPYEEWEVLFRKKLLVERGLLHVVAGITERPREMTELAGSRQTGGAQIREHTGGRLFPRLAAIGAIALFAWVKLKPRRA